MNNTTVNGETYELRSQVLQQFYQVLIFKALNKYNTKYKLMLCLYWNCFGNNLYWEDGRSIW